ncbi:tetratricopeptide repeat protein 28 [Nematolebias whitei]|uniref:tetratricopeptide repeat protein 28 n=1 Tax=Nematolebias whitei TaxID=451745 RepID=UPI00189ADA34|nr:tetratricopeptide repeat protein 28 [Nematolebias whitei]
MEKRAPQKEKTSVFGSRTAGRPFRYVAGDDGARYTLSKAEFMEKVQQSNEVCQRGDFQEAVRLYSEALRADPQNCILYSNRSAAFLKLGRHQAALEDAGKACELNPKWPKSCGKAETRAQSPPPPPSSCSASSGRKSAAESREVERQHDLRSGFL